jgi:hypothetical protein
VKFKILRRVHAIDAALARWLGDAGSAPDTLVDFHTGGPYTDALRKLGDEKAEDAVAGASGTHVVLPGYYCPRDQGLLDYNTSDGRFLFFLPSPPAWKSASGPRSYAIE